MEAQGALPDMVELLEGPILLCRLLTELPKLVVGTWSIVALDQGRLHPMAAKEHDMDRWRDDGVAPTPPLHYK